MNDLAGEGSVNANAQVLFLRSILTKQGWILD